MSRIEAVLHRKVGPVFRGPADPDVVAIDTETYYDKEYGIETLGTYGYVTDRKFDPYLVSVHSADVTYVGNLAGCPWDKITNRPWVAHNMSFDAQVLLEAQKRGWVPEWVEPASLDCTADLAVYMKAPRSLAKSSRELLGRAVNKETRDLMKGKTWDDAVRLGLKDQLLEYARTDAELCYLLATKYAQDWPEQEIRISRLNRKAGSRGVHLNTDAVEKAVKALKHSLWVAGESIPWEWGGVKQNKTPLSLDKAREQCRRDGIPAPTTFKEDDEESSAWEEKYADTYPWIRAVRHWRKANRLLKLMNSLHTRCRRDGTFPYLIKYFGAGTGRFSGGDGVNMQNLPRDPFDLTAILADEDPSFLRLVDTRSMFVAPAGKKLFISDLSQVEPRVLLHLVGDNKQLQKIREGFGVYEAHARATMGWTGGSLKKENPSLYRLAKARCLSGDTLVLTDTGYKPISKIKLADMVWDGVEYVKHSGVVCSGFKPTITMKGDELTKEHEIFYSELETVQAGAVHQKEQASKLYRYRRACSAGSEIRPLVRAVLSAAAELGQEGIAVLALQVRNVWRKTLGFMEQPYQRKDVPVCEVRQRESTGRTQHSKMGA